MVSNPDSIHQRSSAAKAGTIDGDDEGNEAQRSGKDIEKMLNLKTPRDPGPMDQRPLKMMDIVRQIWSGDFYFDPEEDWKEKNGKQ